MGYDNMTYSREYEEIYSSCMLVVTFFFRFVCIMERNLFIWLGNYPIFQDYFEFCRRFYERTIYCYFVIIVLSNLFDFGQLFVVSLLLQ